MTKNNPNKLWRSVTTDSIKYDPLTGTYHYKEKATVPQNFNQFWTPMGQPKRHGQVYSKHKDKKYE